MALRLAVLLSLLGLAATPVLGAAPREPTGKWVVNFDDAQCLASRNYGSLEAPFHLILKAPPVGEVMQIALLRTGYGGAPDQVDATITIDAHASLRRNMLMFGPKNSKFRVYSLNMPSEDFLHLRDAKSISIRSSGLNETFSISQMGALLKTMEKCVADLRKVWNVVSPDGEQSSLKLRARADLAKYLKSEDYPAVSIRSQASGVVRFAILIDEAGKIADCTVVETSGVAALDAQTCVIMKARAKFEPAVGADGKPAKDATVARVRWVLP